MDRHNTYARIKPASRLPRPSSMVVSTSLSLSSIPLFSFPPSSLRIRYGASWVCVRSANGVICVPLLREGKSRILLLYFIVDRRRFYSLLPLPFSLNYISRLVVHIPVSLQQLLGFLLLRWDTLTLVLPSHLSCPVPTLSPYDPVYSFSLTSLPVCLVFFGITLMHCVVCRLCRMLVSLTYIHTEQESEWVRSIAGKMSEGGGTIQDIKKQCSEWVFEVGGSGDEEC